MLNMTTVNNQIRGKPYPLHSFYIIHQLSHTEQNGRHDGGAQLAKG